MKSEQEIRKRQKDLYHEYHSIGGLPNTKATDLDLVLAEAELLGWVLDEDG